MESINISMSNSAPGADPSPAPHPAMSIDKLFPALLECFGIILCGYAAGRANIITSTQAKGLGNFVSRFALPALLFKNMVLLDFGNVIWPFLWSILVAKLSVFFIVCVLTLLVTSKDTRFSKAGLFSIFATQSNDFALGYPIVEALYRNTHPEYLQYIYLVAPVSLMVLNPIGFAFCEVQKRRGEHVQHQSKLYVVGVVLLQVLRNPIVFMVVVGIASHFLLGQKIPPFMEEFVDGLANSFGGAALFYLGLTMVGQLRKLTKSTVVALILLITAKLLMMPLICRGMVEVLDSGNISSLNHSSLSNYAFLYGVFPTAPSVAIYAAHYNMELQVVTSGMVISTFLSAPIMYVSAWLLTIPWMDPKPLASALQNISFNISIVSLFALVWCVAVKIMSKKFCRLPHMFTVNLFVAQLGVCIGMIAWNFVVVKDNFIGQVFTFTLLYGSLYSTYIWPGKTHASTVLVRGVLYLVKAINMGTCKMENVTFENMIFAGQCGRCCDSSHCLLVEEEEKWQSADKQIARHVLLCLLLTVSLLANLSSCLWWLLSSVPGRLYLELQFFCAVLNFGQGFISFGIFGLDKHLIILPFKKRQAFGQEAAIQSDVSEEIRLTCNQFLKYHKEQCVQDIVHKKRCGKRSIAETFLGSEMVQWLQTVGLASDQGEALLYGSRLLEGGVIHHITHNYGFLDDTLHYRFTENMANH
uniref:DEP domain-containing protein n=1 Tax=Pygocentrus nattereri TaxID=42514 RepID=A0A3B4CU96_PYGNA